MEHVSPKEEKRSSFCISHKQILPKACLLKLIPVRWERTNKLHVDHLTGQIHYSWGGIDWCPTLHVLCLKSGKPSFISLTFSTSYQAFQSLVACSHWGLAGHLTLPAFLPFFIRKIVFERGNV